jgi:hypothetical protein
MSLHACSETRFALVAEENKSRLYANRNTDRRGQIGIWGRTEEKNG